MSFFAFSLASFHLASSSSASFDHRAQCSYMLSGIRTLRCEYVYIVLMHICPTCTRHLSIITYALNDAGRRPPECTTWHSAQLPTADSHGQHIDFSPANLAPVTSTEVHNQAIK